MRHFIHCDSYVVLNYVDDFIGVGYVSVAQHSYDHDLMPLDWS